MLIGLIQWLIRIRYAGDLNTITWSLLPEKADRLNECKLTFVNQVWPQKNCNGISNFYKPESWCPPRPAAGCLFSCLGFASANVSVQPRNGTLLTRSDSEQAVRLGPKCWHSSWQVGHACRERHAKYLPYPCPLPSFRVTGCQAQTFVAVPGEAEHDSP